jgi:competence protein ComEA
LDLNTVNEPELERIQGIGKLHAKNIIDYRTKNGPFKSWDDLRKVQGFSNDMMETLKRYGVHVGRVA